jgi:hypothetical protein
MSNFDPFQDPSQVDLSDKFDFIRRKFPRQMISDKVLVGGGHATPAATVDRQPEGWSLQRTNMLKVDLQWTDSLKVTHSSVLTR